MARRCASWLRDHSGVPPGYHDYLRLDALLGLSRPLTPPGEAATRLDERFFIVVHQATELWLTQISADLRRAAMCAAPAPVGRAERGDAAQRGRTSDTGRAERADPAQRGRESDTVRWAEACGRVERATATVELLVRHLDHLDHLPPGAFLAFRDRLGTASGADSEQCRELLLGESHPCVAALRDAGTQPSDPVTARRLQVALDEFVELVHTWRTRHAQQAWSFIGGRPGTGGTSGVRYLAAGMQASDAPGVPARRADR